MRENQTVEIRVAGYLVASQLLEKEPGQWHALVLLDAGRQHTDFVETHALSHLYLYVDDILQPRQGKQLPTKAIVERGLAFAEGKHKLLVACRAGRGRSVALAYLIACREYGAEKATHLLDPTRHFPNRLIISIGDTILRGCGALDGFENWRKQNANIHLADYYDRLEREFEALEAQGVVDRICKIMNRR